MGAYLSYRAALMYVLCILAPWTLHVRMHLLEMKGSILVSERALLKKRLTNVMSEPKSVVTPGCSRVIVSKSLRYTRPLPSAGSE